MTEVGGLSLSFNDSADLVTRASAIRSCPRRVPGGSRDYIRYARRRAPVCGSFGCSGVRNRTGIHVAVSESGAAVPDECALTVGSETLGRTDTFLSPKPHSHNACGFHRINSDHTNLLMCKERLAGRSSAKSSGFFQSTLSEIYFFQKGLSKCAKSFITADKRVST